MPIPIGAAQRRLHSIGIEASRESPTTESKVRGIILGCYTILDEDAPLEATMVLESSPGMSVVHVQLLTGKTLYLPLDMSLDEKEMIFGNSVNMKYRPVEIIYNGENLSNGKVSFGLDPITLPLASNLMPRPFDVFGGMS